MGKMWVSFFAIVQCSPRQQEFEEVEYVSGLENPPEASKNIIRWLVKNDDRIQEIKKFRARTCCGC
jgi:hypothetical protein